MEVTVMAEGTTAQLRGMGTSLGVTGPKLSAAISRPNWTVGSVPKESATSGQRMQFGTICASKELTPTRPGPPTGTSSRSVVPGVYIEARG